MKQAETHIVERAKMWLDPVFDEQTRQEVERMLKEDPRELTECFFQNLEFGTGGLRGIMGVGTNRMNKYTVGLATQGLANYLIKNYPNESIKVAIAYDSRNQSPEFARITAQVLSANGMTVYLFESLRPTPELSFTIRHLQCHSGIVLTASHNPKEYNGYKVYGQDGGQLIAPHDQQVIDEVLAITDYKNIKFNGKEESIHVIGADIDAVYLDKLESLSLSGDLIAQYGDMPIVFTPLHGTGVELVPMAMKAFGFKNVILVPEQAVADGNFPTVKSPNPEEASALQMAIDLAKEKNAQLVMATDPDADRVGIAVRNPQGEYVLLNGNETASLMIYYMLNQWKQLGKINGKQFLVKTIVTTEILKKMAEDFGVECFDVLTGFKYIAQIIRELEGKKEFIAGGEESYGYLVGNFVRDKDAIISCCMIAETAVWAQSQGKNLLELLQEIHLRYGLYREKLISLTKKGIDGLEEIKQMMEKLRNNPPASIAGSKVALIKDYHKAIETRLSDGSTQPIALPKSNVIQIVLEDQTIITARPSGTEPKIKFYFGLNAKVQEASQYQNTLESLNNKANQIIEELDLK